MITPAIQTWLTQAAHKITQSPLTADDLAALEKLLDAPQPKLRQRLLYAHTALPVPTSQTHTMYVIEPVPNGGAFDLVPNYKFPYNTVHEAVIDGWQIVSFPDYKTPIQDREIDIPGYQFILQKIEVYHD